MDIAPNKQLLRCEPPPCSRERGHSWEERQDKRLDIPVEHTDMGLREYHFREYACRYCGTPKQVSRERRVSYGVASVDYQRREKEYE